MASFLIAVMVWGLVRAYLSHEHDKRTKKLAERATANHRRKGADERYGDEATFDARTRCVPHGHKGEQSSRGSSDASIVA